MKRFEDERIMLIHLRPKFIGKRGVILPLTGIIIGAILFIFLAIGVDLRFARGARAKASLHLEEACRQAARQLPNTRNAIDVFQGQMRVFFASKSSGGLGGIPMTRNVNMRIFSPTLSRTLAVAGSVPALNQSACPFSSGGISCRFFGNLNLPPAAAAFPPEPFWNLYGAAGSSRSNIMGDAIGCQLSMQMYSFMGEAATVVSRSAWQLKPRGAGVNQPVSNLPPLGPRQQRGGGLLIGVATEMGVRVKAAGTNVNTRFLLNPTINPVVTPLGAASTAFAGNRQSSNWLGNTLLRSIGVAPATDNLGALELEERRTTCANPAVFVRNTMLTALVERAARGWLRDKTEIVSINPITFNSPTTLITSGEPPTIIVRGGQDLVVPVYQLPALTFKDTRSGIATNLNPVTRGVPNAAQNGDRERFGQLRDCYHVYGAGGGGVARPNDVTIANYVGALSFEPASITNQTEALTPAPNYIPGVTRDWDQNLSSPRGLTAGQTVAMLGGTRYCPSGANLTYPPPGAGSNLTYNCPQPSLRTTTAVPFTDLRPDIINFLDYALSNSLAHPMPGPSNPTNPGVGTLRTFSNYSHVLLFTHVPITPGEIPQIRTRVTALNLNGRFVTVVYIPTNFLDATDTEITRYKQAFLAADPAVPGSQSSQNVVFHIWPRAGGFSVGTEDQEFRTFWSTLLTATGPNNAASRAKWLWLPRLMYEELKF